MKHLDELTLLRMVDGELPSDRRASTRAHIVECATCQAVYESLKTETELLRATLREDDEPLPEEFRSSGNLLWFLAAALLLTGIGISQFWNFLVDPMLRGMDRVGVDGQSLFTTVVIRGLLFRGWTNMVSTLTQVALWLSILVALGTLALFVWRRIRSSAPAMSLLMALAALAPSSADAAVIELEHGTYVLPAGQTLDNDLVVTAEIVRIEGIVKGDLVAAGRLLEVSGRVEGDVLAFAEEIDVTGSIGGNIRTGSRSLDIEGLVERNVTAAGEILRVGPGAEVRGSFTAAGREAILAAPVARDLMIAAETHRIDSRVGGSALLLGDQLTIGDGAVTEGKIEFYGGSEPSVAPGATLAFPVAFERLEEDEEGTRFSWLTHFLFFWAAAFVLGAAFVLLAPRAAEAVTAVHLPQHAKSFLVGLLSVGAIAALAFGLMITLVGLPLGLTTIFFWCLGLYLAQVYAGLYIGRELLGRAADRSQLLVRLAVGLLAIHIAKNIPYLGHVVTVVVALWGFGALVLFFLDALGRTSSPPAAAPLAQEPA